jgi:hypothetical protein
MCDKFPVSMFLCSGLYRCKCGACGHECIACQLNLCLHSEIAVFPYHSFQQPKIHAETFVHCIWRNAQFLSMCVFISGADWMRTVSQAPRVWKTVLALQSTISILKHLKVLMKAVLMNEARWRILVWNAQRTLLQVC